MENRLLDIRLFGPPIVEVDGERLAVDTRKAVALLAYVAVEGVVDRERAASLLWPDSPSDRARATLRRTLSSLRGGIGERYLQTDRDQIALRGEIRVDVDEFDSEVKATLSHGHRPTEVCSDCLPHLRAALSLYRGDFLESFLVRGSAEFEDWVRNTAESVRPRVADAYQRLANGLAGAGDYNGAIRSVREWMALDPLHEPAHRSLMLFHAWVGDRSGAIQAYRNCIAILDQELGVPPLAETTELYEAVLDEDLPPAPGGRRRVTAVEIEPVLTPTILGRSRSLGELAQSLSDVNGRPLAIVGDSWMGKTRMLDHLAETAKRLGVGVISARAFRSESDLPYGVVRQLLDGVHLLQEGTAGKLEDWVLSEIARLDPSFGSAPGTSPDDPFGPIRIREALLRLFMVIAHDTPLVVTIDDIHWIDEASASTLGYILHRLDDHPLLIAMAYRPNDPMDNDLRDVLRTSVTTVRLDPLTVGDLVVDGIDVTLADIAVGDTGGVPILVSEALQSGGLPVDSSTVDAYVDARLETVSELGRQLLATATVLAGHCDAALLRATSGRSDEEVVAAVEELTRRSLLREFDDEQIGLPLEMIRSRIYLAISPIRRRLLHSRASTYLSSMGRVRTDVRLATAMATHLEASGDSEAADWFKLAGDLGRDLYANAEAEVAYRKALALGVHPAAEVRLALGELAFARADYELALGELQTSASQAEGETLAVAEHRIGSVYRRTGRFEWAVHAFGRAEPEHPHPADLYADWALLHRRMGDSEAAVTLAQRSLQSAADDPDQVRALAVLGLISSDPDQEMEFLSRALALADHDHPGRMAVLNNKADLLARAGQLDEAAELVSEGIELARRFGYLHQEAALLNHLADIHHRLGNREQAEEALTGAVTIFANIDAGDWEPEVWLLRHW